MSDALRVENLAVDIGELHILESVNLAAPQGQCTALLGRNGAGKTTALRAVMGLVPAAEGSISFFGDRIDGRPPHHVAKLGIGYAPEDRGIFGGLTVGENIHLAQRGRDEGRLRRVLKIFPDLERFWNQNAATLSGGQQQMLSVARALVNPNRLLLIDEPSKGLAPIVVERLAAVLSEIKREVTIVLVEQNFSLAAHLADYGYVLDDGRTVFHGKMTELNNNDEVKRRYLGVT